MQFGGSAIGNLARMICGDAPYTNFPYRSSSFLTAFFESLNLDYRHDGSTRYWWVRATLEELNKKPPMSEEMPSEPMVEVIEYLLHPDQFVGGRCLGTLDRTQAIGQVNEVLKTYELQVEENPNTGVVTLKPVAIVMVSTAHPKPPVKKAITFVPLVFDAPDHDPVDRLVSVMMPFAAEFNPVYSAIQESCKSLGLECYRADDLWQHSTFIQDIFELIYCSKVVIVDFTGRNPNVMYETGIAHTLGKAVIPITQSIDDIPSDLKPHRALKYLPNGEGMKDLSTGLAKRLRTIIEGTAWTGTD